MLCQPQWFPYPEPGCQTKDPPSDLGSHFETIFHFQLKIIHYILFDCCCPHKAVSEGSIERPARGTSKGSATAVLAGECKRHGTTWTPSQLVTLPGKPVVDENRNGNEARATGTAETS